MASLERRRTVAPASNGGKESKVQEQTQEIVTLRAANVQLQEQVTKLAAEFEECKADRERYAQATLTVAKVQWEKQMKERRDCDRRELLEEMEQMRADNKEKDQADAKNVAEKAVRKELMELQQEAERSNGHLKTTSDQLYTVMQASKKANDELIAIRKEFDKSVQECLRYKLKVLPLVDAKILAFQLRRALRVAMILKWRKIFVVRKGIFSTFVQQINLVKEVLNHSKNCEGVERVELRAWLDAAIACERAGATLQGHARKYPTIADMTTFSHDLIPLLLIYAKEMANYSNSIERTLKSSQERVIELTSLLNDRDREVLDQTVATRVAMAKLKNVGDECRKWETKFKLLERKYANVKAATNVPLNTEHTALPSAEISPSYARVGSSSFPTPVSTHVHRSVLAEALNMHDDDEGREGDGEGGKEGHRKKPLLNTITFAAVEEEFLHFLTDTTAFDREINANGNGIVSFAEAMNWLKLKFPLLCHPKAVFKAFQRTIHHDSVGEKDEFLEKEEFNSFLVNVMYYNRAFEAFDGIDSNADEHIDFEEFLIGLKRLHMHVSKVEAKAEFIKIDVDKSGFIRFEEFCDWMVGANLSKFKEKIVAFENKRREEILASVNIMMLHGELHEHHHHGMRKPNVEAAVSRPTHGHGDDKPGFDMGKEVHDAAAKLTSEEQQVRSGGALLPASMSAPVTPSTATLGPPISPTADNKIANVRRHSSVAGVVSSAAPTTTTTMNTLVGKMNRSSSSSQFLQSIYRLPRNSAQFPSDEKTRTLQASQSVHQLRLKGRRNLIVSASSASVSLVNGRVGKINEKVATAPYNPNDWQQQLEDERRKRRQERELRQKQRAMNENKLRSRKKSLTDIHDKEVQASRQLANQQQVEHNRTDGFVPSLNFLGSAASGTSSANLHSAGLTTAPVFSSYAARKAEYQIDQSFNKAYELSLSRDKCKADGVGRRVKEMSHIFEFFDTAKTWSEKMVKMENANKGKMGGMSSNNTATTSCTAAVLQDLGVQAVEEHNKEIEEGVMDFLMEYPLPSENPLRTNYAPIVENMKKKEYLKTVAKVLAKKKDVIIVNN